MGKRINRFLSTIMLDSALSGLTSCVEHVEAVKPSEIPESTYSDVYSSNDQISKIVNALGADNDLVLRHNPDKNGSAIRLAHNNGKPIEVAFAPGFEDLEKYTTDSLDYLFGVLGDINDNYKYEVVDFTGIHDHQIVFQTGEGDDYYGTTSFSSRVADDGVYNIEWGIITIYKDAFNDYTDNVEMKLRNTITHEMMHLLGFDDIYVSSTSKYVGNTLINPVSKSENKFATLHITPNDYDNFLALYSKPSQNLDADLEQFKKMSDAYKNFYYENWMYSEFQSGNAPIESLPEKETYQFSQRAYLHSVKAEELDYQIDVDGDTYSLKVTDKTGNVLEEKTGKISSYSASLNLAGHTVDVDNAVMVIEDFDSEYYFTSHYMKDVISEGAITSLMIYKHNGKYVIKDMFSMQSNIANEMQPEAQMQ